MWNALKNYLAESMKPFKLKRHFEKEHPTYTDRDVSIFERKADSVKKSRLDTNGQTFASTRAQLNWRSKFPNRRCLTGEESANLSPSVLISSTYCRPGSSYRMCDTKLPTVSVIGFRYDNTLPCLDTRGIFKQGCPSLKCNSMISLILCQLWLEKKQGLKSNEQMERYSEK
ncbi:zinc finger BED domain-containing protein 5-like [Oopsacas minuta]|uniref:Zinc finger BED domain-containing protein 5-like n=1 Tax=Oopsacas minuta TaxID=111878 RepID=A0AAV7JLW7_9METZ|nr:zinc finger BED domain-containing protein 5-like [Oopsacas minuta]